MTILGKGSLILDEPQLFLEKSWPLIWGLDMIMSTFRNAFLEIRLLFRDAVMEGGCQTRRQRLSL